MELPYILPSEKEGISLEKGVETCSADRLGKADFAGWILARSLLDEINSQSLQASRPSLRNIKSFSIGAWQDPRWALYADRLYDGLVDPIVYYREILVDLLRLMQSSKPVAVCTGTWANVGNLWKDHEPHISAFPSLRVFHPKRDQEDFKYTWLHHPGPSRVFLYSYQWNTGVRHNDNHFKPSTDDSHDVFEVYRKYMQYVFDKSVKSQTEDGHCIINNAILDDMSLEICIVPEIFDVGDVPNIPYLLDVAKRLKTAVEQYHEKLTEKEEYAKICLGKIKVHTAEALPACPCCGLREEFGADIYVHDWGSLA